jgi:CRISPR-associated protein Cas5d
MKFYNISMEISGKTAMFTNAATGSTPVSYPAPTYSASKQILESVLWWESTEILPIRVEICQPIRYYSYITNYGGPLRKADSIKSGNSFQLVATVLIDVCYRIHARIRHNPNGSRKATPSGQNLNSPHAYQEQFNKMIQRGQSYRIPCLGWSEFTPDYFGPFRPETEVQTDINESLPSMLKTPFPDGTRSDCKPRYYVNVAIRRGVLVYV